MLVITAIMQDADWNDYRAFLSVARAGQMARAARTMGVDATTIGRRLRRLEQRLDVTLFEQTREGQMITPAGEKLLAAVERMAEAAAAVEPSSDGQSLSGSVRISVSEGFGNWIAARHLGALAEAHPRLTLDLVASSGFLSPSRHEADIAVLLSRPRAGPLMARKLSDYALCLYASADYLAAAPSIHTPENLREGHRLIGYIPDLIYTPELDYLSEIALDLVANLRSSSILAQHRLIAAGTGIGVLPCFIGENDRTLVPVLPHHAILRSFWLVTHKDTHKLARIQAVTAWLIDMVRRERSALLPPLP